MENKRKKEIKLWVVTQAIDVLLCGAIACFIFSPFTILCAYLNVAKDSPNIILLFFNSGFLIQGLFCVISAYHLKKLKLRIIRYGEGMCDTDHLIN